MFSDSPSSPGFLLRFLAFGFSSNSTFCLALFADSTKFCKKFGFGSSGSDSPVGLQKIFRCFAVKEWNKGLYCSHFRKIFLISVFDCSVSGCYLSWSWWIWVFNRFFDSLEWFMPKNHVILLFNHLWLLFVRLKQFFLPFWVKSFPPRKKNKQKSAGEFDFGQTWSAGGGAHTGVR